MIFDLRWDVNVMEDVDSPPNPNAKYPKPSEFSHFIFLSLSQLLSLLSVRYSKPLPSPGNELFEMLVMGLGVGINM